MAEYLSSLNDKQRLKFSRFINHREELGRTVLYLAAETGRVRCAHVLLLYGASPDIPALNGHTPLVVACLNGYASMIEVLLRHGASPLQTVGKQTLVEIVYNSIKSFKAKIRTIYLLLVSGCVVSDEILYNITNSIDNIPRSIAFKDVLHRALILRAKRYTQYLLDHNIRLPLPASTDPDIDTPFDLVSQFVGFDTPCLDQ